MRSITEPTLPNTGLITTNNAMPLVNLNGNSREDLTRQWEAFHDALTKAVQSFPHDSFHGRNHHCKPAESEGNAPGCKRAMLQSLTMLQGLAEEVYGNLIVEGLK